MRKETGTCHNLFYERRMVELRIEEWQPELRMEKKLPKRHIGYNLNGSTCNSPEP